MSLEQAAGSMETPVVRGGGVATNPADLYTIYTQFARNVCACSGSSKVTMGTRGEGAGDHDQRPRPSRVLLCWLPPIASPFGAFGRRPKVDEQGGGAKAARRV